MKKPNRKLKPLTPKELVLATGGVVPIVLGSCTFDYTPISSGTNSAGKSDG